MAILIENTVVVHPQTGQPVLLAATGELPRWAEGLVGDHLLDHNGKKPEPDDENARLRAQIADLQAALARSSSASGASVTAEQLERPSRGDSREKWAAYAKDRGAPEDELVPVDEGGLTRDRLREKYGA